MNVRTSARSRLAAALAGIGSITLVLGGVALVGASSASAEPMTGGTNDCKAAGIPGSQLKLDPVPEGVSVLKGSKGFEVKVTVKGLAFDFEASRIVYGVAVKGGPGLNVYKYTPDGQSSGTGLRANINPNNDQPYGLSHITFCYNPCPPSTSPTPTKPTIPTLPTSPTIPTVPTLPTSPTVPTDTPTVPTVPTSPTVPTEQPSTPTAPPTESPSNPVPSGTPSAPGDETPTSAIPTDVDAGTGGDSSNSSSGGGGGVLAIGLLTLGAALLATGGWVVVRRRGQHSI